MHKIRYIVFIGLLMFQVRLLQAQPCPFIPGLSSSASLPNPCISYKSFSRVAYNSAPMTFTTVYDFGDGSSPTVTPYSIGGIGSFFDERAHVYNIPGTYVMTMSILGPGSCSTSATNTITVSGYCQTCPVYSVLSTGFDRANNVPYTIGPYAGGTFDPYWNVIKRQDIAAPNFTPIPGTTVNYTGVLAYDIWPNFGPYACPYMGNSRYISVNSTYSSVYGTPNLTTYRTFFNLPNPLPANKTYSLVFSVRSDDAVYQITLNGTDVKPPGYSNAGTWSPYLGPELIVGVSSCSPGIFQPGSNYIDIGVSDTYLAATELDAEILLYECSGTDVCVVGLPPCSDCIGSFAPSPDKKYLLSGWAKEKNAPQSKTSYTYPSIDILYPSISGSAGPFTPSGQIIDGWQRIEGEFTIPANATDITVKLNCSTGDCYYDDIRVLPFDGAMKSYVYDPVTMRLVAELDERNFATFYEYDEEGILTRVKKETEKGKMTIKENRENKKK